MGGAPSSGHPSRWYGSPAADQQAVCRFSGLDSGELFRRHRRSSSGSW